MFELFTDTGVETFDNNIAKVCDVNKYIAFGHKVAQLYTTLPRPLNDIVIILEPRNTHEFYQHKFQNNRSISFQIYNYVINLFHKYLTKSDYPMFYSSIVIKYVTLSNFPIRTIENIVRQILKYQTLSYNINKQSSSDARGIDNNTIVEHRLKIQRGYFQNQTYIEVLFLNYSLIHAHIQNNFHFIEQTQTLHELFEMPIINQHFFHVFNDIYKYNENYSLYSDISNVFTHSDVLSFFHTFLSCIVYHKKINISYFDTLIQSMCSILIKIYKSHDNKFWMFVQCGLWQTLTRYYLYRKFNFQIGIYCAKKALTLHLNQIKYFNQNILEITENVNNIIYFYLIVGKWDKVRYYSKSIINTSHYGMPNMMEDIIQYHQSLKTRKKRLFDIKIKFNKIRSKLNQNGYNKCMEILNDSNKIEFIKNMIQIKQCNYSKCMKKNVKLKKCKQCVSVYYCCKNCQKYDWKLSHKFDCQQVDKRDYLMTIKQDINATNFKRGNVNFLRTKGAYPCNLKELQL